MKKWLIILLTCTTIGLIIGSIVYMTTNNSAKVNTSSNIDINDIKSTILSELKTTELDRDSRFIQILTEINIYDSWLTVPVTFLDELPDSYDRQYLFILKRLADKSLKVVGYQPPGFFNDNDIPQEAPEALRSAVIGEAHGE